MQTPVYEPECPSAISMVKTLNIFTGRKALNAKVYDKAIGLMGTDNGATTHPWHSGYFARD